MADQKIKLTNNHKTFLAGFSGTLVAVVLVLGSVGVARAFHDAKPHHKQPMGMMMEGDRGGMRGPGGMAGEITKIEGNTITLKGKDDATITVSVDDNTNYQKDGDDAKLSDLKVGDTIVIRGDVTNISINADGVSIRGN